MEAELRRQLPNGNFSRVSRVRSRVMSAVRGKGNKTTELRLRMAFVKAGLSGWTLHAKYLPGRPDFCFRSAKLLVFVDGCFWHGCPACGHVPKVRGKFWDAKIRRNRERDKNITEDLRSFGFRVIRFWEHDLRISLNECVRRIYNGLSQTARQPKSKD